MATQNNRNKFPLTTQNFIAAINGNSAYYITFQHYLTATALGFLSDWKEKADDSFVTNIVDDTITKCGAAITRGKRPSNMKQYLREAIKNALLDSKKINPDKVSLCSVKNEEEREDEEAMLKPKYGYHDNNAVDDEMKKVELNKINERIFNYVRKYYGAQIYRMLQVKYDWELSEPDMKKLAAIFSQCKSKDCSTTTFLSQELGLTPDRIRDKIHQYEKKLKVDVPKYIISQEQYKDMMTFITEDQLKSLSSVNPETEMSAILFSSLVYLQENMDPAQLIEMLQKESFTSYVESSISETMKRNTDNKQVGANDEGVFVHAFDGNLLNYGPDFEIREWLYIKSRLFDNWKQIPDILIKNNVYQLILCKYLQLFARCWEPHDEQGNNERFGAYLNCSFIDKQVNLDDVAQYLSKFTNDNPSEEMAKEFFHEVSRGKLEFACLMHIINGYTAWDLAEGCNIHFAEGTELRFERCKTNCMIFLPE